ncbi:mitochondrial ribosomal protein L55 (predicted), isoform CRA_c [Rattus norvegicus]|uniref:Mitochondrial ribosomal protein L55 (Predicted), isoform CRA_c n=1 Tax=Rattus norvegicus TaxID=10116 RepID=A6HEY7_RAT|nr:mitochondrial ribosomal protein L55 (predicted), isoform CRA_c [Rattus norvegicus]
MPYLQKSAGPGSESVRLSSSRRGKKNQKWLTVLTLNDTNDFGPRPRSNSVREFHPGYFVRMEGHLSVYHTFLKS